MGYTRRCRGQTYVENQWAEVWLLLCTVSQTALLCAAVSCLVVVASSVHTTEAAWLVSCAALAHHLVVYATGKLKRKNVSTLVPKCVYPDVTNVRRYTRLSLCFSGGSKVTRGQLRKRPTCTRGKVAGHSLQVDMAHGCQYNIEPRPVAPNAKTRLSREYYSLSKLSKMKVFEALWWRQAS